MRLFYTLSVSALALSMVSCSGNKSENAAVGDAADYSEFSGANAISSVATIDSLAMEADFLTPRQGVSVLVGLSEIVKNEQSKGTTGKKLEYMRKYVDTYDILVNRSDEFKEAIDEARGTAHVDLGAIFNQYRDILSGEADGSVIEGEDDGGTTSAEAKPAPAKADSASAPKVEAAPADTAR